MQYTWECACSMRHRKEINDLTDQEFARFAEGLNKLKADGFGVQCRRMMRTMRASAAAPSRAVQP